jgi:hypothetical protein
MFSGFIHTRSSVVDGIIPPWLEIVIVDMYESVGHQRVSVDLMIDTTCMYRYW